MENILKSLISDTTTVTQNNLCKIIIEDTFDIFCALIRVGNNFIESPDLIFGSFQMRCRTKNFSYSIVSAKERKTPIFIPAIVVV